MGVVILNRRQVLKTSLTVGVLSLLSGCGLLPSQAPVTKRIPRIGYLALSAAPAEEAFRLGLRELGYVEGENIVVEWRRADGQEDRLPQLATELLRLDLDVLVTRGTIETRFAKQATSTLPVVFTTVTDPVGAGLVTNLARPEANVTGISNSVRGLHGKRLEFLKEAVPSASRIAVMSYFSVTSSPATSSNWQETYAASQKLGVHAQVYDALEGTDLDDVFAAIQRDRADAFLLLPSGPVFFTQAPRFAEFVAQARLPSMFEERAFAAAGGLLAYGAALFDAPRRSAIYVDRLLKGAKPADLPVEQPTKFDFVVNLKTAQALGLTIPPSVLAQATEVIQ
jgi:putative tryptophan/tyrosine transport system substrate-binding protein